MTQSKHVRIIFYVCWTIALILQATFTELLADEAYYWKYSQALAWGYFDHPPVIALLIKAGYFLFANELGVRSLFILCNVLTIWIWEVLIKPKQLKLFYLMVLSVGILHFVGFIATTDAPFLLFSSCFILLYKHFLEQPNWKLSLLLAITVSAMLLTKYHGLVVIGLVVLSNHNLLKSRYFWLTTTLASVFMIPHIMWQVEAGFPSFKYHLFERSHLPYQFTNTLEYIATQPFVFGPVIGFLFFIAFIKFKPNNLFDKAMVYLFWGGYTFFFIMSFKGRIEAYWTLFALIPSLYIGYYQINASEKLTKVLSKQFPYVIVLIVLARIYLMFGFLPNTKVTEGLSSKFHHKKSTMKAIHKIANNTPVVFMNSYQKASLYEFYTGVASFSLNNVMGRKNQYTIWKSEEKYRGEEVMIIPNFDTPSFDTIPNISKTTYYTFIKNFQSYSQVGIQPMTTLSKLPKSDTISVDLSIVKNNELEVDFTANKEYPSFVYAQFFNGNRLIKQDRLFLLKNSQIGTTVSTQIVMPQAIGRCELVYSIKTGWLPHTANSDNFVIEVID